MTIVHLAYFWLVLAIPLAVYLFNLWIRRKNRKLLDTLGQFPTLRAFVNQSPLRVKLKEALLILALIFLLIAALRPQWGLSREKITRQGLDMVVVLDISASMFAEDLQPNRLTKSIMEIKKVLLDLKGDRVGLVTFAGSATAICPLTLDYGAIELFLQAMKNYQETRPGTNLTQAYQTAVKLFDLKAPEDKLILLFTDGEDHEGNIEAIKADSHRKGIIVIPIAVGSRNGQPVPNISSDGVRMGYKKDKTGHIVISRTDLQNLQKIASLGPYVLDTNDKNLSGLVNDLSHYNRKKIAEQRISIHKERYQYFLFMGLILILVCYLIKDRS